MKISHTFHTFLLHPSRLSKKAPIKGLLIAGSVIFGIITLGSVHFAAFRLKGRIRKEIEIPAKDPISDKAKEILKSDSTSETEEKKEKSLDKRQGQICITTQTGGYVGEDLRYLPPYYSDLTLEDGLPIPLESHDFFVQLHLFDPSQALEKIGFPDSFYLPGSLLEGKEDGEAIHLKYKGKPVTLVINQNHKMKFAKGSFEEVFASQKEFIRTQDAAAPFFGKYDEYWWYRLGEKGALFKLEKSETGFHPELQSEGKFRQLQKPEFPPVEIKINREENFIELSFPATRFIPSDVQVILNETHLIIYGYFDNRPLFQEEPLLEPSKEFVLSMHWDQNPLFTNFPLDQMQRLVREANFSFKNGMIHFYLPLDIK